MLNRIFRNNKLRSLIIRNISTSRLFLGERATFKMNIIADEFGTKEVEVIEGQNILQVCQDNDIVEIEGACDGTLACSTCHVCLERSIYDQIEPPCEDEEDILDMAVKVVDGQSRLGCQVKLHSKMKNIILQSLMNLLIN